MVRFERATVVEAPLERVWAFHSTVDGLEALTPDWMGVTVEVVRRPVAKGDELVTGSELLIETRPFGVLPGVAWLSRITARKRTSSSGMFRDEALEGPFEEWVHTHRFVDVGFGTLVHDHISYRIPGPGLTRLAKPALAAIFAYRHRRTHALLADVALST